MNTLFRHIIFLLLLSSLIPVQAQTIKTEQTDSKTLIITFEPSGLKFINISDLQDSFLKVVCNDAGTTTTIGSPALPVIQRQLLSPLSSLEKIEVLSVSHEIISLKHKIIPFYLPPKRASLDDYSNIRIDSAIYASNSFLPASFYELGSEYSYAGIPQFDIRFYPVRYNPATAQADVVYKLTLKLTFKNSPATLKTLNIPSSITNQKLTSGSIKMAAASRSDSEPPSLLIVTHASLYNQAKELAEWKMRKGIRTKILKTSDISLNPDADQIKTRIIAIHDTFSFDHLILLGDVSLIPAFYGVSNTLNDHSYSTIIGNDFFPDIALGRFSDTSATQCATEIHKSMNYEKYPDISNSNNWFKKATSIASNSYLDNNHGQNMVNFLRNAGFDSIDDLRAMIGSFRSDLLQKAFSNGRSWVFYIGHGTENSWSVYGNYTTNNLNYLNNNNMLPVVVSVACQTADISFTSDCLGERWMNLGERRGSVAFIGATELTEFYYSDTLGEFALFGYFDRNALTIGSALNYGKMQMYNSFPGGTGSTTEATMQMFLLLGDPTLMPWTNTPTAIQTDLKKHFRPGQQLIKIKVSSDSNALTGALTCLSTKDFSYYQTAYTDSAGDVYFYVNPDSNSKYYITISGYNLVPLMDSIMFDTLNSISNITKPADISMYPNPLKDHCIISSHTPNRMLNKIEVLDLNGRIISDFININSFTYTLQREQLKTGLYLLRITDSSGYCMIKKLAVN